MAARQIKIITLFVIIICLFFSVFYSDAFTPPKYTLLDENTPNYAEYYSTVIKWKEAIVNKDFKTLLTFAMDHYIPGVTKGLNNESSLIFQVLFSLKDSAFNIINNSEELGVLILDLEFARGGNFYACFYDKTIFKFKTREEAENLPNLFEVPGRYCHFFFKFDDQWYMNWEFGQGVLGE